MKLQGLPEQFDSPRTVFVGVDSAGGAHVVISVDATSGANSGTALLTPTQARQLAHGLHQAATLAEVEQEEQ